MVSTRAEGSIRYLFAHQFQHLLLLLGLIPGFLYFALPALDGKELWSVSGQTLAYTLLGVVIVHQIAGWLVFRLQLCFGLLSRFFGVYDLTVWGVVFFVLFLLRPVLTLLIGIVDAGSLPGPRWLQIVLGILLLPPAVYTIRSVFVYFGIERALGGDHFREEYRHMPFVKKGAFHYSDNAMYSFAFLFFWAIALFCGSTAALAAALFQHAYIWVHWYCTEAPDLDVIYSR